MGTTPHSDDPREVLYMHIGWELMDLRQDIEFANLFATDPYPADVVVQRLTALQNAVAAFADKYFPVSKAAQIGEF